MITLKGMTWSHDRGIKPLEAASAIFSKTHPNIEITWDARSLSDFELFPLEELANKYDFIMIDHPHIGTAYAQNLLLPLDTLLPKEFIANQKVNSVGQSFDSYTWEGHQWALPADAAAQVCAYREDLLNQTNCSIPTTWNEVFELGKALSKDQYIGIPFVPVHAYSSFFSLASQCSSKLFWSEGSDLDVEVGVKVLKLLESILSVSHEKSFDYDPIQLLDDMATNNEFVYTPLIYGYSNYSRPGYLANEVIFRDMPSDTGKPEGSMIGGVGLSITSKCEHVDLAKEFIEMAVSEEFQKTIFYKEAGQPGHRIAWSDLEVNSTCNDFFSGTLKTLDLGSMRPRFNGYIDFQAEAGSRIRKFIKNKNTNYEGFIKELNELINDYR